MQPALDIYAAFFGALRAGAVPSIFYYPSAKYDRSRYLAEMHKLLAGSRAKLVVVFPDVRTDLESLVELLPEPPSVVTQADAQSLSKTFHDVLPAQDSVAFMQYSSGTTGLKKGLQLSHSAALWQLDTYAHCLNLGAKEVFVTWLPLYHDMGLIACMLLPMTRGNPIIGMSPHTWIAQPALWLEAVARHQGTRSWMPNFAFNLLARRCTGLGHNLSSLRSLTNCSEPVLPASHDAFIAAFAENGVRPEMLRTCYAMAETTFAVTQSPPSTAPARETVDPLALARFNKAVPTSEGRELLSSGRALPETLIDIRNPDGESLPERTVGEIFVSSPCLFSGYFANESETEKVLRDGIYATGDLGFLADAELYVVGRARDTIVVGGQNLYPQDIEAALAEVSGIAPGRSVAFGIADASLGTERLVVLAERDGHGQSGVEQDDEAIRAAIFACVATTTRVTASDIRLVPPRTLVKSSSGKLSRSANRDLYLTNYAGVTQSPAMPSQDTDGLVATISAVVRRQLARTPAVGPARAAEVGENTPLISSGLIDSFALVDLIVALEEVTDRTLPLRLMANPVAMDSIGAIARALAADTRNEAPVTLPSVPQQIDDIALRHAATGSPRFRLGFWSLYMRFVLLRHGIQFQSGLRVLGPVLLRLDGDPRNIRLGRNVTLMPWVDLKVREQGRIELGDDVVLDTCARVVAARDGAAILGDRVQIAMSTIINAGDLVVFGRDSGIAAHGNVIASEHRIDSPSVFMETGYVRKPVLVGEGVWIAAGCLLRPGSRIGDRAVIGAHSVVEGDIPAGAIAMGQPARPVRFRVQ